MPRPDVCKTSSAEFQAIRMDNWGATVEKIEEFVRVAAHFQLQLANDI
jgi:hypothetical protein